MTSRVAHGSFMRNPGRCFVTASSHDSLPSSARIERAAHVKAFVLDAMPNCVSASTAAASPTRRTP